jgi:WD40 repeat protein/serine/threonine protein kinase
MTASPPTNETIFHAARDIRDVHRRREYVREACGGDAARLALLEAMLGAADAPDSLLDCPAGSEATLDQPVGARFGDVIGPYKLLEQIGEGGFGVVFMAEQTSPLRRKVALKLVKPGMDTHQVVARFEAERQALALMDHPNIAKVLDAGATELGRPYFVMELVRGIPITKFCDDKRLTARERLGLFISVCQAVQHAHQKGIIHRDLKPSNVLVTLHDGVPVPKVIDFGVAKALGQQLTEKTLFTGFAQLVGTPLYMSPEQAELSGLDADTRTDIFSLGVLLYELLTGTTPLDKDRLKEVGYDELRRIIREEEPPRPSTRISTLGAEAETVCASRASEPRKLSALVRGELDWIVMKCLEKDRNRRYETVAALVADVRRFLNDEPVQACPPSAWYRFHKLARRNRRALVTASVLALAALLGVGALAVSTVLVWKANKDLRDSVDRERLAADRERWEAYFQRITVAHRELSIDNLAAALRALDDCPEDLRGWEWYYLMRLCKVEPLVIPNMTEANGVAFSPNGDRLASAGGDGVVRIRNSRTGKAVQEFKAHNKAVASVVFHPDGRHLASAGADGLVKVWDLATEQAVFEGPCDALRRFGAAYTVAFRPPDGRHLAAGSGRAVRVWDWMNRELLHAFPGHENHSIPLAFSRDGRHLVTGGASLEGQKLWNAETWRLINTLPAHPHPVSALAFSPDGTGLASASFDRSVKLWDTTSGELRRTCWHTGNVMGVAFSPDGQRLASCGEDKTVRVWDATTGREVLGLRGHTGICGCVVFSPDGQRLASASTDRTIRVWDATPLQGNEGQEVFTFIQHNDEIRSIAVSPDGERIVSGSGGTIGGGALVKVWDAATGRERVSFTAHTVIVFGLAWHPDGQCIATAGADLPVHSVKIWDARTGREVAAPQGVPESLAGAYNCLAFSPPDGRYLVTGHLNGAVQVWDARTGQEVGTLGTHGRELRGVAFSRDGRHLASASGDGKVKLWNATRLDKKYLDEKPEPRHTLQALVPGPSVNIAFSPDGKRLATGGEENTVKIWDVQTGNDLRTLEGHNGDVYTVAFSPDDEGRWIASGSEDSTVRIWDSRTGKLIHTFRGHTGLVSSLAFSPDGQKLYSGSRDKTVKVWDLTRLSEVPDR